MFVTTCPNAMRSRRLAPPGKRASAWPHSRPASCRVSRKRASGFFRSASAPHARQVAAQAADEHPACTIFSYQTTSGYTVAPNSIASAVNQAIASGNLLASNNDGMFSDGSVPWVSRGGEAAAAGMGGMSSAPGSNTAFLVGWLTGALPSQIIYGPNSKQTQDMMGSPGAAVMRTQFYAAGGQNVTVNYGTGQAAWDTIVTNPLNWSSTALQVGGFGGATVVNNGNGSATFTIVNVAGTHSFFYHVVPNSSSNSGPMHNVTQTFIWTEPVRSSSPAPGGNGPG